MIQGRMVKLLRKIKRWLMFNSFYLGNPPWDSGITPPELQAFIQEKSPGRALDLGCGTGTNLLTLAEAGWQVVGLEYAMIAVRRARRRLSVYGKRAQVHLGSVTELDYLHKPFDLILDIGCYHGLGEREKGEYHANLQRLLAPGGSFLLYAHMKAENKRSGITEEDIVSFSDLMKLVSREDGIDHGTRPSVWLRYERRA